MLVSLLFCLVLATSSSADIVWNKLDVALSLAEEKTTPILLLSTRKGCKPCKKLLDEMTASKEFQDQSQKIILAKVEDKDIAKLDKRHKTEGKYVPKVVFINHNGILIKDLDNKNKKSEKTRYFYKNVDDVLSSMPLALEHFHLDSGFGKDYMWYDWSSGLAAAKEQNKPILVIFHQDWCGACQRLKPLFADSKEIKELTFMFIMINTDEEDVVKGEKYKADGEYYPKILFLDSDGDHITEEINYGTKHKHVLHYYGNGKEVRASMERVITNITEYDNVNDNGYGKHIKWVPYTKGLQLSKELKRPMMLLITKSYCAACKAMKPKIKGHQEFATLSKKFVMVTVEDDDEPDDDQFDVDGAYIPRIFFLDSNGKVDESIRNERKGFAKSLYAYGNPDQIVENMKVALEKNLGDPTGTPKDGEKKEEETKEQPKEEPKEEPKQEEQKQKTEEKKVEKPVANEGFSNNIKWYNYTEGVQRAKKNHMIGLVLFYNNYCQFSYYMKEQFNDSPQITELAEKFVMIHVSEEEAETEKVEKYDIDGKYTPKLFIIDPDENVQSDINNTLVGSPYDKTLFYYGAAGEIVKIMKIAQERINVTLGRGFGEYIQWVAYERALEVCKEKNMPMMVIIHKNWCGACKALKPTIKDSRPIWELSKWFVMVNTEDAEEPLDNDFFKDGGYYPRIVFLDSQGKVHHDLHNRDPAFLKYKYSFAYEDQIVQTMKFAIGKFYNTNQEEQPKGETQEIKSEATNNNDNTTTNQAEPKTEGGTKEKMLSPGKKLLAKSGVQWNTIKDALLQAKESNKPIFFLVHRTTCPACKATIKMIARDPDFKEKSEGFILADIEDDVDDELADSYDIDGTYVPRIYMLDPDGKIFKDLWNVGTNFMENKFYFFEAATIHRAMEKALKKMETWAPGDQANESNLVVKAKDEL